MRAVARGAEGNATALVVGPDNKVESRQVKLGDAFGDAWIVTEGLRAGERVIVEGLQKARAGSVVKPVPAGSTSAAKSDSAAAAAKK
jgi:membrane fusion protein (multidrug efflux system)